MKKNLIKNLKPDVIFSKGGYVALPTVIAAKKLGVPVISHESDLSMGLANKIALKYSAKMLTAFEKTADGIQKAECVGIPLDKKLFCERDKAKILKKFGFERGKKVLLITGGSQGSRAINEAFGGARDRLLKKYNVIHLCGKGKSSGVKAKGLYETEFAENMGESFRRVRSRGIEGGGEYYVRTRRALPSDACNPPAERKFKGRPSGKREIF